MDRQRFIDGHINALFAQRLSHASGWGAVIFLVLAALVAVGDPVRVSDVRPLFISASLLQAIISLAARKTPPDRVVLQRLLALASIAAAAAAIEVLILKSDGASSPYYAGMILLGFCAAGFMTAPVSFHAIAAAMIYGIYAVPLALSSATGEARIFFLLNITLIASLFSAVLMRHLFQKNIGGELGLRYDLDRRQTLLEEDVKGQAAQLNATIRDLKGVIAERKKAEQELRESEKKYRLVVESAGEGILVTQDGNVKFVNSALAAMTGYAPEEIIGRPFFDFVHPGDWSLVSRQFARQPGDERSPDSSWFRIRTRSAAVRWAEMRGAMASWEGSPASVSFISDVTERKKAEDALRESEEKFRALFEESRDVFYISTPGGRFLDINPAGIELFGYASRDEILAIDLSRDLYVSPRDRRRFVEAVSGANYVREYEVQMKRRNGEKLTVIITGSAIRDDAGGLIAIRGIIRNVTEQRRLEQQLLQSQKMEAVGQLAGGIAHDFNNILTAIVGYANLLQMKREKDDPHGVYIDHILSSAERAASLTHSLLAFSRKQVMNPKPIDVNEVIGKVEKLLLRLIGEDIELVSKLAAGELIVFADSHQLEQVLMNLATNARDSMPRGGHLTIETRAERRVNPGRTNTDREAGDYAVISVADTGTGMDETTREKIFEPFFTTKEVGKGTGLGLAMVYGIIKQHEGFIEVTSEVGQGAMFEIFLPMISQRSAEASPLRETAAPPGGAETILLGEDDDAVRTMTTSVLVEYGYTVIAAKDGDESVRKFLDHRDRISMLILDVVMPKKNGREVYEEISRLRPGIKVLFTSGYTADIIRMRGTMEEGPDFLPKPVVMSDLLRKIREILDHKQTTGISS